MSSSEEDNEGAIDVIPFLTATTSSFNSRPEPSHITPEPQALITTKPQINTFIPGYTFSCFRISMPECFAQVTT